MSTNALAEQLIATVARAFYTDTFVAVLDVLVHEKYVKEQELGPRLKLPDKEVQRVLQKLESEMMVKSEELADERGRVGKYYYVDYQLFVNVVRYRVALMQRYLASTENQELRQVHYECPTCHNKYSDYDIIALQSADRKFICAQCCPFANLRAASSQPEWTLLAVDNRGRLSGLQLLEKKMGEQLSRCPDGLHEGIYDLLFQLRDASLARNLPSDNRARGLAASRITDEDVRQRVEESLRRRNVREHLDRAAPLKQIVMGQEVESVSINVETGAEPVRSAARGDRYLSSLSSSYNIRVSAEGTVSGFSRREESLPEFLRGSGIKGADETFPVGTRCAAGSAAGAAELVSEVVEGAAVEEDDVEWED